MTMLAFLQTGGLASDPGPEDCATAVADAVEAGPPGLNAGGGGELHATRPEQTRPEQIRPEQKMAARVVVAARAGVARGVAADVTGRWRWFMRLMSSRM